MDAPVSFEVVDDDVRADAAHSSGSVGWSAIAEQRAAGVQYHQLLVAAQLRTTALQARGSAATAASTAALSGPAVLLTTSPRADTSGSSRPVARGSTQ